MLVHKYEYEVVVLYAINFCINEGLLLRQKEKRGIYNNLHFHEITLLEANVTYTFLCELRIASRFSRGWKLIKKETLWLFCKFSCVQNIISPRPNIVRAEVINCLSFFVASEGNPTFFAKIGFECSGIVFWISSHNLFKYPQAIKTICKHDFM